MLWDYPANRPMAKKSKLYPYQKAKNTHYRLLKTQAFIRPFFRVYDLLACPHFARHRLPKFLLDKNWSPRLGLRTFHAVPLPSFR